MSIRIFRKAFLAGFPRRDEAFPMHNTRESACAVEVPRGLNATVDHGHADARAAPARLESHSRAGRRGRIVQGGVNGAIGRDVQDPGLRGQFFQSSGANRNQLAPDTFQACFFNAT